MNKNMKMEPLEDVIGLLPAEYDVFFSYAHADNQDGAIDKLVSDITQQFRSLTGIGLKIFQDRTEIITADFWKNTIEKALARSRILVAFLTPSYLKSEWCKREWFAAEVRESKIRFIIGTPLESSVIIPVKMTSLSRARLSGDEEILRAKATNRQWIDFSDITQRSVKWRSEVRKLTEDIIDQMEYQAQLVPASRSNDADIVIVDDKSGLMWAASVPLVQFSYSDAEKYVSGLTIAGHKDWRLPSSDELETLIDPHLKAARGESATMPLRSPFNKPNWGWLHSGSPVPNNPGCYIMNISNGHIFNGLDREAFVRAVRTVSET